MSKHYGKMNHEIKKGDLVRHATRGVGEVLDEWGTWLSCRNCFKPFPATVPDPVGALRTRGVGMVTVCCREGILAVSGTNIFDVKFRDGKTYSINGCWLRLLSGGDALSNSRFIESESAGEEGSRVSAAQTLPEAYLAKLMSV